jgi:hypothetical protein
MQSIALYNMCSQLIEQHVFYQGRMQSEFDVTDLVPEFYLVLVEMENGTSTNLGIIVELYEPGLRKRY